VHVLLATDGSDLAVAAARRAIEVLDRPDRVTALSVMTYVPGDDATGFAASVDTPEEAERRMHEERVAADAAIAATVDGLGELHTEERTELGTPGPVVCAVAKEVGADVVVVGSHGRGGLARAFLGSVSDYVIRHAPCPVLVVRQEPVDAASS
jgi:nucleotide-binding universal stress UspA family protein